MKKSLFLALALFAAAAAGALASSSPSSYEPIRPVAKPQKTALKTNMTIHCQTPQEKLKKDCAQSHR